MEILLYCIVVVFAISSGFLVFHAESSDRDCYEKGDFCDWSYATDKFDEV